MVPGRFEITLKVFLVDGDQFMVLHDRASGEGDLPGGRLGPAEISANWIESIDRELSEELGPGARWRVSPEPIFMWPHRFPSTGQYGLGIAFLGVWEGGVVTLSDEHDGWAWLPLDSTEVTGWFHGTMLGAVRRFQQRPRSG